MKEIAIVYMVAGMSSRFGGAIKQFVVVGDNDKTLIEVSMDQAVKAGFQKIVFIVGKMTEVPFKEKFGDEYNGIPIVYAKQDFNPETRDKPWGTVDATVSIKGTVDCPFVVCNGDDLYGEESFKLLFNHLQESQDAATLGYILKEVIPEEGSVNRGIFQVENDYVTDLRETFNIQKATLKENGLKEDELCSMNIFAFHPEDLDLFESILNKFKEEHKGDRIAECLLPVETQILLKNGSMKMRIYPTPEKWIGVTNPGDEELVRKFLKV